MEASSSRPELKKKQKQQRVAVGHGNAHLIAGRRLASDAVTLQRCRGRSAAATAAAADAAVYSQFAE